MNNISHIICIFLCAALLFTGCAAPSAAPATETPAEAPVATEAPAAAESAAPAEKADPNANKIWPDPSIDGNLPQSVSPADDFAAYINHDWYKNTTIPDGYTSWSSFSALQEKVRTDVLSMLKNPDESDAQQKAAALFASAMDKEMRDTTGNSTLMRSFNFVKDVKSISELNELFAGDGALYFFVPLVNTGVTADFKNSAVNVAMLSHPPLSLGDSAEYTEMTEQGKRFKAANEKFYKELLTHNGINEAEADKMIADAYAWEEKLAAGCYPLSTTYRPDYYTLIYNEYSPEDMAALCPDFPLMKILENGNLDTAKRFIVTEPEAIKTLNSIYTEENLDGIKAYIMINMLAGVSSYGDSFSADAAANWSNEKYGSTGFKPDEQRAYDLCNGIMSELIGKSYAEKYFGEESKADVTEMVDEIMAVMKTRLSAADWLTEATRNTAIEKLDTMTLRIGYPTSLGFDWDAITVAAVEPFIENVMNMLMLMSAQQNAKADMPVDKEVWEMGANTVNAYYMPTDNSINFPAAILQAPFYSNERSRSANLGGIGMVIAHEITHAFDTMGSQFDKDGNMKNWWTEADSAAFKERTDKVAARYAAIEVIDGEHVRGDLTIGETVADLGGMSCTLDVMRGLDGADYSEYFTAYTNIWAERCTPEMRVYMLKTNAHAPGYLRANVTVQQFQEFYDTYGVKEGDFMYTAPEDRLMVW